MLYFAAAFTLLFHVIFWGLGAAMLLSPRRWRRFWPVWIAPAGLALQSMVVWAGAHTNLAGTDAYGRWALLLPLALLLWAGRRQGWQRLRDLRRFTGLGVVMAGCLVLLTLPVSRTSSQLTTVSIGSCDAADYAAGARVFKEFASDERGGFIGHEEVVRVGSVDNFYDFWLKLNHFTPSALMALNGSILGLEPWQITSVLTLLLVVLTLPQVFWLGRAGFGFGDRAALWLAFIYGISPICWYAAYHVATAQILAAMGIALLTWCGLRLWRDRQGGWHYAGLLFTAYALLWGAYNFIIIVCLVPAVACVGGWALAARQMHRLWPWLWRMLGPLTLAGVFFYSRVIGVAERFLIFQQTDFGWQIPPLMPEGWLGLVADTSLEPWQGPWAWIMSAVVLVLLTAGWIRHLSQDGRFAWQLVACLAPVMLGYGFLVWRGWRLDNNASYDAYKLFAVFYPVLLAALCPWLRWIKEGQFWRRTAIAMMAVVTIGNVHSMGGFATRMGQAPLMVEPSLKEVQEVEALPHVTSLNMMVPDLWARLWANTLLLRKPQYFQTHSYEGRYNAPMRGEWDLMGSLVQLKLPDADSIRINHRFSVIRTASPYFLRARLGRGWYDLELLRSLQTTRWRWNQGHAGLELDNPHQRPLRVALHITGRSLVKRDLQVWLGSEHVGTVMMGEIRHEVSVPAFSIPPGRVSLDFRSEVPPVMVGEGDSRQLGFAVYGIVVEVLADKVDAPPNAP